MWYVLFFLFVFGLFCFFGGFKGQVRWPKALPKKKKEKREAQSWQSSSCYCCCFLLFCFCGCCCFVFGPFLLVVVVVVAAVVVVVVLMRCSCCCCCCHSCCCCWCCVCCCSCCCHCFVVVFVVVVVVVVSPEHPKIKKKTHIKKPCFPSVVCLFSSSLSASFSFFLLFLSFLSFFPLFPQGECDFYKNAERKRKNTHFVEPKICPILLRNMIGQIFNSTFFTFLALFSFLQICSNPYFYRAFSKT